MKTHWRKLIHWSEPFEVPEQAIIQVYPDCLYIDLWIVTLMFKKGER